MNEDKQQLAARTVAALKKIYPDAMCSLTYTNPIQLLIAVRLSAQCTDARVNKVTPVLFAKYPTLDDLCHAGGDGLGVQILLLDAQHVGETRRAHGAQIVVQAVLLGDVPHGIDIALQKRLVDLHGHVAGA